jgi:hypothetical protein
MQAGRTKTLQASRTKNVPLENTAGGHAGRTKFVPLKITAGRQASRQAGKHVI